MPRRRRITTFYDHFDPDAAAEEILANQRKRNPKLAEEHEKVMAILKRRQAEREAASQK